MMFRHLQWHEAADLIIDSMGKTIGSKVVTYDFARLWKGQRKLNVPSLPMN
jgi:isocitrate dehydrogenase